MPTSYSKFLQIGSGADRQIDLSQTSNALALAVLQLLGSTSGTLTHLANASTTSHTITWPATQGGANTFAKNDGSGNLSWVSAVTSVAFSDASSAPIYSISGSPVTASGTLTQTLLTQTAGTVFAGPTSGGANQPSFRAL